VLAVSSLATNMVSGDANGAMDVFVRTIHTDPFEYGSSSVTSQSCLPRLAPCGYSSVSGETELTILGDDQPSQKIEHPLLRPRGSGREPPERRALLRALDAHGAAAP
jgi:hypothetical protein